jgi:hypothetical protein
MRSFLPVVSVGLFLFSGFASADDFETVVINNAAFGSGPIQSWSLDITTGTATATGSFVPTGASDSNNGRAIAVTNTQFYYSELTSGFGPTVSVETGPYNGGAGGPDNGGFTNPIPGRGIQNLHFGAAGLYIVSGYPTQAPEVFIVDPTNGTILNTPVTLATDPAADGFTILPNGNYLVNEETATASTINTIQLPVRASPAQQLLLRALARVWFRRASIPTGPTCSLIALAPPRSQSRICLGI